MKEPLDVYVPRRDSPQWMHIHPGSAMVARPTDDDRVTVYLEGNIYDIPALEGYRTKLLHAADRCRQRYPTIALVSLPKAELMQVGVYVENTLHVTNQQALSEWTIWRCECGAVVDPEDDGCHLTIKEDGAGGHEIVGATCADCMVTAS